MRYRTKNRGRHAINFVLAVVTAMIVMTLLIVAFPPLADWSMLLGIILGFVAMRVTLHLYPIELERVYDDD